MPIFNVKKHIKEMLKINCETESYKNENILLQKFNSNRILNTTIKSFLICNKVIIHVFL